jgi:hypothetical protein
MTVLVERSELMLHFFKDRLINAALQYLEQLDQRFRVGVGELRYSDQSQCFCIR